MSYMISAYNWTFFHLSIDDYSASLQKLIGGLKGTQSGETSPATSSNRCTGLYSVSCPLVLARHLLYTCPLAQHSRVLCTRSRDMSRTNMVLWVATCLARPDFCYTTVLTGIMGQWLHSRPSPPEVFDHFQNAKMEREGLGTRLQTQCFFHIPCICPPPFSLSSLLFLFPLLNSLSSFLFSSMLFSCLTLYSCHLAWSPGFPF